MRKQLISGRKNTIKNVTKSVLSSWNFIVTISSDILMKIAPFSMSLSTKRPYFDENRTLTLV